MLPCVSLNLALSVSVSLEGFGKYAFCLRPLICTRTHNSDAHAQLFLHTYCQRANPPPILSRAPMRFLWTAAAVAALMLSSMMMSSVHAGEEYAPSPEVCVHVFRRG